MKDKTKYNLIINCYKKIYKLKKTNILCMIQKKLVI